MKVTNYSALIACSTILCSATSFAGVAGPSNLLMDGGFTDICETNVGGKIDPNTTSGQGTSFRVDDPNTHGIWLDREKWRCALYDGNYYADQPYQSGGNTDLLYQGFPTEGTCLSDADKVTLKFRYRYGELTNTCGGSCDWTDPAGATTGTGQIMGFGPNGVLNYYAPWPASDRSLFEYAAFAETAEGSYTWQPFEEEFTVDNPDVAAFLVAINMGWQNRGGSSQPSGIDHVVDDVQLYISQFDATVRIEPETLNPASQGKWIMAVITLPECFDAENVNDNVKINKLEFIGGSSTGTLGSEDSIFADSCKVLGNGNLQCKFPRAEVIATAEELSQKTDELKIRVRGTMYDGRPVAFSGLDVIRYVIRY